jgi:hypothetical protein
MKKFLCLFAILAVSCSIDNENETFYQTYGVVKEDVNTNGKLYVRSDDGKVVIPAISSILSNDDRDKRVWMTFSTSDDVKSDTIKANVYDFLRITEIEFSTENEGSGSDNVDLREIWLAQDYLTMVMKVRAGSENSLKNHQYFMYSNTENVNDTVRMEFKYDRKNDAGSSEFNKILALKLNDIISPAQGSDSVVIAIKYHTDAVSKERFLTYKK